jgi:hemoglobin-like flavoprotein
MDLDIDALQTSFDHMAARGDELMDVFFERLFAAAPSLQPLFFAADMKRVKGRLLVALVLLRTSLHDLESVMPVLRGLGARHVRYGARPGHYPVAGEALIASMAEIAGDAWAIEHEKAWTEAFAVASGAMLEGAHSVVSVTWPFDASCMRRRLASSTRTAPHATRS